MKIAKIIKNKIRSTRISLNKMYIFRIDLDFPIKTNNDYNVAFINEVSSIDEIIKERGEGLRERYSNWFQKGYLCLVASKIDDIVGMTWFVDDDYVPIEFNQKHLINKGKEVGIIDSYVLKKYRGKGVYSSIWYQVLNAIKEKGYNNAYGYIRNDYSHSFIIHEKLGMKDVVEIVYSFRFLFVKIPYRNKFLIPCDIKKLKRKLFEENRDKIIKVTSK